MRPSLLQLTTSPRLVLPVVIVAVSIAIGGGLLARDAYQTVAQRPVNDVSPTSLAPEEQPGPRKVQLTRDAAKHPQAETVTSLLQTYFDGINDRDFDGYKASVTSDKARDKTEQQWLVGYRTTKNGSVQVHRLEYGGKDRLVALVSFTSTQDPADAPVTLEDAKCIRWRQALPIVREQGHWKIANSPPGSIPGMTKC